VNVLVNSANPKLDLNNGAVSASLLRACGNQLQQECRQTYPNGVKVGEVAETSGGQIPGVNVYHGALPAWTQGGAPLIKVEILLYYM
jgi:O-acetyl-ADP-ribose deacetylase (regulator of RNase III)